MLGSVGKFFKDRKGAFAMQFALLAVPLTVCTGLSIDGGRAFLARYELASALDAAALAIGSTVDENADLNAIAQKFVNANFHGDHQGPIALQVDDVGDEDETVILKGQVTINTFFMPIVGQPTVTVAATSEIKRGGNNVEVAMVLDITGSMSGSRISDLRTAASDLVDTVVSDLQEPYYSKVALIPYSMGVNMGDLADEVRGDIQPSHAITAAGWRDGNSQTVTGAHWRNGSGKTISAAAWKNGTAKTITKITKVSSNTRIQVTTSASHGYTNGQYVRITGANGSYTGLNNNVYCVADPTTTSPYTFNLKDLATCTSYVTPPSGSTNSTAGSAQRCYNGLCQIQVTTATHGFSTGDRIYINGVTGMTEINSALGSTWGITVNSTTTFLITDINGPTVTSTYSSGGTASECYNATCQVMVTTSASHGFATGDHVRISGVGGATWVNNSSGQSWTVDGTTSTTFFLAGTNPNTGTAAFTANGTVGECFTTACEIRIQTADAHGIANGSQVYITGVTGLTSGGTGINTSGNNSKTVNAPTASTLILPGTDGPSYSSWTGGGAINCLAQGCQYYRFTNASGSNRILPISTCVSERIGADAYKDTAPNVSPVGLNYAPSGNPCLTNEFMPLTSDKEGLKSQISTLAAAGSTAGQIGIAWGWYALSPDWAYLFPSANQPAEYGEPHLAKVAVLMTDGEFNTPYCNGVIGLIDGSVPSGSGSSSDHINCNATNGDPFDQAEELCKGMKDKGVIVYTVGFDISSSTDVSDLLNGCATDEDHVFFPETGSELKDAFKDIAHSIAQLRVSR